MVKGSISDTKFPIIHSSLIILSLSWTLFLKELPFLFFYVRRLNCSDNWTRR